MGKINVMTIKTDSQELFGYLFRSMRSSEVFEIGGASFAVSGVVESTLGKFSAGIMKVKKIEMPKPTTPSWSGEGRPPVGVECLVCWTSSTREYYKAKIIAYDDEQVIYRWLEGPDKGVIRVDSGCDFEMGRVKAFLPLLTPEQIAADEREAAIKNMASTPKPCGHAIYNICAQLCDAGYRKQEQPK